MTRIKQLLVHEGNLYALTEDGILYVMHLDQWFEVEAPGNDE